MGPCVPLHLFYAHTNLVNGMMFLSNLRMNGVCLFNKGQVFFFFFFLYVTMSRLKCRRGKECFSRQGF